MSPLLLIYLMTASLKPVDSCNVMYYQLNAGVGDSMNFNPITTNYNILYR